MLILMNLPEFALYGTSPSAGDEIQAAWFQYPFCYEYTVKCCISLLLQLRCSKCPEFLLCDQESWSAEKLFG